MDATGEMLRSSRGLAALLVDVRSLARIERRFGAGAYKALRDGVDALMLELRKHVRQDDLLVRDESQGDCFLLFVGRPRDKGDALALTDLRRLADRVQAFVAPRVARLTLPYLREKPNIAVGYGFVIHSPIESEERQVYWLVHDAQQSAALRAQLAEREQRERLVEIVYNQQVWTVFQPIHEIRTLEVIGYEALSRGPRGSDLQPPNALFGLAARHDLTELLERCCRRQAFQDWRKYYADEKRLFVNTVPATVRDTSFLGRGVLDYLGPSLSPSRVTLEITEHEVIENLNLYRDAMHSFLDLGFTFAIDDVGAGYSGLETIAKLGVAFLKIDMSLVRDVHQKRVSQQMVRAILDMGEGIGAAVIAEGIETQEEYEAIKEIGVHYGQGYLWGRPVDPRAPKPPQADQPPDAAS